MTKVNELITVFIYIYKILSKINALFKLLKTNKLMLLFKTIIICKIKVRNE